MLKFFAMTVVTATGLTFGQGMVSHLGAGHEGMSMYASRAYDGVEREMSSGKHLVVQRGVLTFDARESVKFVAEDGDQLMVPYKSIKSLEYSFYNPIQERRESGSKFVPKFHKVGGKRYLIVRYESAEGLQSTVMAFEPDRYQRVLGTFVSKTGLPINRVGIEEVF